MYRFRMVMKDPEGKMAIQEAWFAEPDFVPLEGLADDQKYLMCKMKTTNDPALALIAETPAKAFFMLACIKASVIPLDADVLVEPSN